ncbi:hypothetical protein BT69DRAFT_884161 [Atractiella rhizophila]|nr:hypothetical protein BT69DRAFT_884161 [Atractiella rhizophila]
MHLLHLQLHFYGTCNYFMFKKSHLNVIMIRANQFERLNGMSLGVVYKVVVGIMEVGLLASGGLISN